MGLVEIDLNGFVMGGVMSSETAASEMRSGETYVGGTFNIHLQCLV